MMDRFSRAIGTAIVNQKDAHLQLVESVLGKQCIEASQGLGFTVVACDQDGNLGHTTAEEWGIWDIFLFEPNGRGSLFSPQTMTGLTPLAIQQFFQIEPLTVKHVADYAQVDHHQRHRQERGCTKAGPFMW